ncbi:MAG: hypothetical protein U9P38_00295 [Campylobacterota bacterium]|nr:hypothetical protein [Campylobacterota bacterium]
MKILLLFIFIISNLLSAPAYQKMRDFKNGDGTVFKAKAQGNQYLNWIETDDGEILKYNQESKNFEYAKIIDNSLKASGTRYEKNNSKRARSLGRINKIDYEDIYKLWKKREKEVLLRRHR